MNPKVSIFKLQIEKWTLVTQSGQLSIGETKNLYFFKKILIFVPH